MGEKIISILERENRPSLSNLLYFIGGLIEIIITISKVAPFRISSDFLDKINWANNFSTSNMLVRIAFWSAIAYILIHILCMYIKKLIKHLDEKINHTNHTVLKLQKAWITIQTIDDTIDLIASVTSFIFIIIVFIQQYKTGKVLFSNGVQIIYFLIAIRFVFLIVIRFYIKNCNIVNKVAEQYPEY